MRSKVATGRDVPLPWIRGGTGQSSEAKHHHHPGRRLGNARGDRNLQAELGVDVSYETVQRWVLKFGPE
jgi:hypothetical protein